jgi:hypothetical protein
MTLQLTLKDLFREACVEHEDSLELNRAAFLVLERTFSIADTISHQYLELLQARKYLTGQSIIVINRESSTSFRLLHIASQAF